MSQLDFFESQFDQGLKADWAWKKQPPKIKYFIEAMPDAPCCIRRTFGITDMSLEAFLNRVKQERKSGQGLGVAYVNGHHDSRDNADLYHLESWDIFTSQTTPQILVVLYYAPVNHLAMLQKHMPQQVESYLAKLPACVREELV